MNVLTNSPLVEQIWFTNSSARIMTTTKSYDKLHPVRWGVGHPNGATTTLSRIHALKQNEWPSLSHGVNRLTGISSAPSASSAVSFNYAYNSANQRTSVTNADGSFWLYQYDTLGQVTSGKKYWTDGSPVAGQQFEYGFDDIGNRKTAASGGNEWGAGLRYENYTANLLNQYTNRTVPGSADIVGAASTNATVTVNTRPTYRKGEYFRGELTFDNTAAPLWLGVTNVAENGSVLMISYFPVLPCRH